MGREAKGMVYKFLSEDGVAVTVTFDTMMSAKDGILELDGKLYRRLHDRRGSTGIFKNPPVLPVNPKTVSSALGCIDAAVDDWREDARLHNFKVDFVKDDSEPRFYNAHFDSEKERFRYLKHRQFYDKNPQSGSALCPALFEQAVKRVKKNS